MNEHSLPAILQKMGFNADWVATDNEIVVWERPERQPTEAELIAAGWIKPEPAEEATEE